jgi:hypothetical protein
VVATTGHDPDFSKFLFEAQQTPYSFPKVRKCYKIMTMKKALGF